MKSSKFTSTPLFPRQALVALLLPLIAEQALSVTIGLADTLMVSSVGEAAVSGVSLVDSFNTLMIQIMSALATGGAVVTSQYIGHQEPKNAKAAAAQILFVLSSFSVLVAAVVIGGRHAILRGIFGSIDADVMHYAETYFLLSALSYPFIGLYNAGAALFRAQGNSKISMLSSLVMNVVNIGGNAVLIYGFGMGVMGAALASLVSRAIACAVVLYLLQKPDCALRVDSLRAMAPNGGLIRRILRVGIPAGIENGMFQIGKLSVSSLTSTLGTAAIAANAVANTTTTFLNIPANAVGMAALTVVGQCLGAGEKEQAVYYSRRLMLTAYCGAWVMNLSAFFFANRFAVSLFNLSPEAQAMALDIMVWFNIVSLFVWPSSFTLPNILRAAGDARFTMTVSIVSMWAFRVGFCYLAVLCFGGYNVWRNQGIPFVWGSWCDWGSLQNVVDTVLVFLLLNSIRYSTPPTSIARFTGYLSKLTLGAYLVSWIPDNYLYTMLKSTVPSVTDQLNYFPLAVGGTILISLLLAAVVECCVSLLMRLLRRSAKVRTAGTAQA